MTVKSNISIDHIVTQVSGNIVSDMDGEKVMLSIKNGKYYNLGEVGGHIWELIEQPTQIINVVSSLISTFEIEPSVCENQVVSFMEQLFNEGLIELK